MMNAARSSSTREDRCQLAMLVCGFILSVALGLSGAAYAQNEIVLENQLTGNPPSEWDISGVGDESIQGFPTDLSVDQGQTIDFKIQSNATDYRLDIYRLGYYGGDGARLVAAVEPSATLPQAQPACLFDGTTNLVDCGNWAVSASWAVPTTATSGIYLAKLVREDGGGTGEGSHIIFIVRDDDGASALLFQTSDTTWQAYNRWGDGATTGGASLYSGPSGKASKVSYNRPFSTREVPTEDWFFNAEYPMVRWLERNGYDVSYFTNIDTDRLGTEILEHEIFLSVGHDEYWSRAMRDNAAAARAAGVHLAFFSGNEVYWKVRWEDSTDGSATPHRTLVCYKEGTLGELACGSKCDPETTIWTGLWRDGCAYPSADGCEPENELTGQISWVGTTGTMTAPEAYGSHWFWQNTSVAALNPGETAVLGTNTLGYEWNPYQAAYDAFYPTNLVPLSNTSLSGQTHQLSIYQHASGAWVFGAGTVQWSWGLDSTHDRGAEPVNQDMQQATVNLFGEMGVAAETLQPNLVIYVPCSPDCTGLVCGDDGCGGSCGTCTVGVTTCDDFGQCVACDANYCDTRECGDDNCGGTCGSCAATETCNETLGVCEPLPCPCSLWDPLTLPANVTYSDPRAIEVGVRFESAVDGYITGVRFYKTLTNTGTHIGNLWSDAGTNLGTVTFIGETADGWQQAQFAAPIPVTAGTTYVASYHTTAGDYALNESYFAASSWINYPLTAPQDGFEGGGSNGVYVYSATSAFPTTTWNSANYWVDVVFDISATDTLPPSVVTRVPAAGANGVATTAAVTATFNEPIDQGTLTFELRDPSTALVASTVTYDAGTRTATLTPDAALDPSTTYDASAIADDVTGNPMAAADTWSFTTGAPPGPGPDEGPGGPILVIGDAANPFGRYFAEILRTEGLNYFTVTDISLVDATVLNAHDVVILGEMTLSAAQVTLLTTWVDAGGKLIAMRPDPQLAGLLGLTVAGGSLTDGYLLIDTGSGPGQGLVGVTIQFHGTADSYTLNGASAVATLYSDATQATPYPAVTINNVGSNGGQAVTFTYDLARSIVYTRQGNPAWVGQERDGTAPIRSDDLFFGNASGDPQPDWVDLSKVAIPQADEQQRLLAKLIRQTNAYPLPRFWYFPNGHKAVVIMTGDHHGCCSATQTRFDTYVTQSPGGCVVEDWECIRASSYVYPGSGSIDVPYYTGLGFEIGVHVNTSCGNFTQTQLDTFYTDQLATFFSQFPTAPLQDSERTHCIAWSDWVFQPKTKATQGIRLDTNYYFWPPAWVSNTPGLFTGSGMPMRFADLDGTMIDVYQAATQMTDESGQTYPFTADTLLDRALGGLGYYGAFTANMHTDSASHAGSDAIVSSALARGVPVVSGRQMLEWLDGRNGSAFESLSWNGTSLTFDISVGTGARNLQAMIPTTNAAGTLSALTLDAAPLAYTTETIKGTEYAIFPAAAGAYDASFAPDVTSPVISNIGASPDPDGTAVITWLTDEASDSLVEFGIASGNLDQTASDSLLVTSHSVLLTGLDPDTTYYYQVTSADDAAPANSTTEPATPASFTTPGPQCFVDDLFVDLDAGATGGATYVTLTDDGELILAPVEAAEFEGASLPVGWLSNDWGGGTTTVSGGSVTVNETRVNPDTTPYGPGHTLEFVANFSGGALQHVGLGGGDPASTASGVGLFNTGPWILFSTDGGGVLQARVNDDGGQADYTIPGGYLGAAHLYRIEWFGDQIQFFIDDSLVHTVQPVAFTSFADNTLGIGISDFDTGAGTLTVDWIRMTPHSAAGSFESRIFDALAVADWGVSTWNSDEPVGTGVSMFARTGPTSVPDGSWSAYTAITNAGLVGGSTRYIQYRADLTSSDPELTPVLRDVSIGCTVGADTFPPVITGWSVVSDPTGTSATVNWTTDESADSLVQYGTDIGTLDQSVFDAGLVLSHSVVLPGLTPGVTYYYQVTSADILANSATEPATPDSFTTASLPCIEDLTLTDFAAGTPGVDTYLAETVDGEVILQPTVGAEFDGTGLPAGWNSTAWPSGGNSTVGGGSLTVDGALFASDLPLYPAGRSLEFMATFDPSGINVNHHVGFATDFNDTRWAIFSTKATSNQIFARTNNDGATNDTAINPATFGLGTLIGVPHLYRIDWYTNSVDFYIDNVLVHSQTATMAFDMRPVASDLIYNDGAVLSVDWIRMTPFSAAGSYESSVFDAGSISAWQTLNWTDDTPAGTSLAVFVRTGDTAVPDGSWTAYGSVANGAAVGGSSQYLQYRLDLATSDTFVTPVLHDIAIECDAGVDTIPPVISGVLAVPGFDTATISWDTNELATSLVEYGTSPSVLDLSEFDATPVTSHSVVLSGLQGGVTYYYRVTSADADTNSAIEPPAIDPALEFTTTPPVCFEDVDRTDFQLGTPFSNTSIVEIDDGEVILQATVESDFDGTTLPAGWQTSPWTTGGGGTVGGGSLSVDGGLVNTTTLYSPGRVLEFVATFAASWKQHAGLGDDLNSAPWAIFSTWNSTDQLYARTSTGADFLINPATHGLGALIGVPHLYRIEWNASTVDYYIDDVLVRSEPVAIAADMRPVFSDWDTDAVALTVDWARLTPYSATGEFYSRVFDSGESSDWGAVTWTADEPAGTSVAITVQAGETATPDGTWISTIVPTSGDTAGLTGRYVQYIADLATSDPDQTPVLREVAIECLTAPECVDGFDCDDSDPCTDDVCNAGTCENNPLPDGDGDGLCDAEDGCPGDPLKIVPGVCGCGVADTDSDGDGTPNCNDLCPADPLKVAPGACGCGNLDTDSDGDGTADCIDLCPADPLKTAPGVCGCGVADTDSDGDGTPNCTDLCPADPLKVAPGDCGCGNPETDVDGDGIGDCIDTCIDVDDDLYGTGVGCSGADCDDTNPEIHPGAPEICDGLDNQCSGDTGYGTIDEEPDATLSCAAGDTCYEGSCVSAFISLPACASDDNGATVVVPVVASPADGIEGINIDFTYDPSVLTATVAQLTAITSPDCNLFDNLTVSGTVSLAIVCGGPLSGTGPIAAVQFAVVGTVGQQSVLDLTLGNANEGGIETGLIDGLFTVDSDFDLDGLGDVCDPDDDNDGTDDALDCDPFDATVYPGAPEIADDGTDQDCNGFDTITCVVDADQDGYGTDLGTPVLADDGTCDTAQSESTSSDDCDDAVDTVYPGAPETADDGIDQDCSGFDTITCVVDADQDGYGTAGGFCGDGICDPSVGEDCSNCGDCAGLQSGPQEGRFCCGAGGGFNPVDCSDPRCTSGGFACGTSSSTVLAPDGSCDTVQGESINADDCNDGNAGINPSAAEIADDGIDQDCNGFDTITCTVDADQDGYGTDLNTPVLADDGSCDAAQSESATSDDCDDNDISIYPAAPETADDGVDQDCNGFDTITCVIDADQDGYGTDLNTPVLADDGSCDTAQSESTNSNDCNDASITVYPAAPEACDGVDNQCPGDPGHGQIDETGNALCDNGLYCDGAEVCGGVSGCQDSAPIFCDDGSTCTTGVCNETSDSCDFANNLTCGVGGTISYYRQAGAEPGTAPVPDIDIDLAFGLTSDGTADGVTDASGIFSFPGQAGTLNVSPLGEFSDAPKPWDYLNVISAFDAAFIAQHSVHLITLTPNQFIAGDVTNNGEVSAYDAAKVAQLAVKTPGQEHFQVALDTGSDWKFLRCNSPTDCSDAFFLHDPLLTSAADDFFAILYGDVSGNWTAGSYTGGGTAEPATETEIAVTPAGDVIDLQGITLRTTTDQATQATGRDARLPIAALTQSVRPGSEPGQFVVTLKLDNADGILGLDLDLGYDVGEVEIINVRTVGLASQFSVASNDSDGRLRLGLFSTGALEGSGEILSIEIGVSGDSIGEAFTIDAAANEGEIPLRIGTPRRYDRDRQPPVPRDRRLPREIQRQ